MPSLENVALHVVAGSVMVQAVVEVVRSWTVTVPVGVPAPPGVTTDVIVTELVGDVVYAVVGLGESEVVEVSEAALKVIAMSQEVN